MLRYPQLVGRTLSQQFLLTATQVGEKYMNELVKEEGSLYSLKPSYL